MHQLHLMAAGLLTYALLSACAFASGAPYSGVEKPPPGKSVIYFYRKPHFTWIQGAGTRYMVLASDQRITALGINGYYRLVAEPGMYHFWIGNTVLPDSISEQYKWFTKYLGADPTRLKAEPGEVYYAKIEGSVHLVPEEQAKEDLDGTSLESGTNEIRPDIPMIRFGLNGEILGGTQEAPQKIVAAPVPALSQAGAGPVGTPRGVAIYPLAPKGGVEAAFAEGLSSIFSSEVGKSACVRLVAEDIVQDLARQQGLEQQCGTESCQIDLAEQAKADILVRGELAKVDETYAVSIMAIDLVTKRTIFSQRVLSDRDSLIEKTANLGKQTTRALACGQ